MSKAEVRGIGGQDWLWANPWWWMGLGLGCCSLAWLWMAALGQKYPAGRFGLLTVGLLLVAAAVVIRLQFTEPAFLAAISAFYRNLILTALALLLSALALAVSVLLVLAFFMPGSVPWRWGPLLICWIVTVPMAQSAALQCFHRLRRHEALSEREEGAVLLFLAALASFCAMQALYDPTDVFYMDSIRLFLSVLTLAALLAAPLVLVPQTIRRKVISALILLHFAGIVTATLAVVNYPKAVRQLWERIYRPYLQFFYLTNAYHFYAPEPGPTHYIWFRLLFVDNNGRETGRWLKIPDVDAKGRHVHSTSLTNVRYMCIMERAMPQESATAFYDASGKPEKFYENRRKRTPGSHAKEQPKGELIIPWHPHFTHDQQYRRPGGDAQNLIRSYVRHVLREGDLTSTSPLSLTEKGGGEGEGPGYRIKGVKIYAVTHGILTPDVYRYDVAEPWDPHTYRGFYLGEYDTEGRLVDRDDPFLHWMLPTIRETPERASIYRCYLRKHAGDPSWICNERGKWVDSLPQSDDSPRGTGDGSGGGKER